MLVLSQKYTFLRQNNSLFYEENTDNKILKRLSKCAGKIEEWLSIFD